MNRDYNFKLISFSMAFMLMGSFMLCDLGLQISSLTKFFIIFSIAIFGFQLIPGAVFLAAKVKKIFAKGKESSQTTLTRNGDTDMKTRQILIADGDKAARQELAALFENSNYEVQTTASAAYAIAKIVQKNEPIVILGDSFEETIAPVDVIALMHKCNKQLQIILISDDSSLEDLKRIHEDGIFYHALKPHNQEDNEELRSAVDYAFDTFQHAMS